MSNNEKKIEYEMMECRDENDGRMVKNWITNKLGKADRFFEEKIANLKYEKEK